MAIPTLNSYAVDVATGDITFTFDFDTIGVDTIGELGRTPYGDERAQILGAYPKPKGIQTVTLKTVHQGAFISAEGADQAYQAKSSNGNPWHIMAYAKLRHLAGDPIDFDLATQWPDQKNPGKFCYVTLNRWYDVRKVDVNRGDDDWGGRWRLVGA